MSFALAILGFAALIVLHEFGHFAAAKAVGMRVERFSLFFGPMFVKKKIGETEYGIGVIPAGGYVRITGMNPEEEIEPEVAHRAYYAQPVWKRIFVISAGPAMNLLVAFAILFVLVASNGYVDNSVNVVQGPLQQPAASVLRPNDQIVAIDGRAHLTPAAISSGIAAHRCAGATTGNCTAATPVSITVRRNGTLQTFQIYPRYSAAAKRMRLGIVIQEGIMRDAGVATAAGKSISQMWYVTHKTVTTFATLFEPKVRKQIHGVVGTVDVTQQEFSYSAVDALYTLAIVSLSLAIINLFPFLPLDGGHIFWAIAEKVRGRRISFATMEKAGAVGFVLIIMLFVVGLTNDISTLSGKGFNVPH
jgi:regulator of sigma E protease